MRQENMQYIANSLKVLVIFLQVSRIPDFYSRVSENKLDRFVINLEYRLKITVFVLIQKYCEDERMERISREAMDNYLQLVKLERDKKNNSMQQREEVEEMMKKKMLKIAKEKLH